MARSWACALFGHKVWRKRVRREGRTFVGRCRRCGILMVRADDGWRPGAQRTSIRPSMRSLLRSQSVNRAMSRAFDATSGVTPFNTGVGVGGTFCLGSSLIWVTYTKKTEGSVFMKLRNIFFATAAATLAAAPIAAQAETAARVSEPVAGVSELGGDGEGIGAGLIVAAIAAIGMIVLIVSDDDDDEDPVSA